MTQTSQTPEDCIQYRLLAEPAEAHLFTVRCRIAQPDPAGQRLSLPAWIPGSYMIRDFARHVVRLAAETAAGQPLDCQREDKSRWRIAACDGPLTVEYQVYARDLSVRGAWLDPGRAYFNGTCVFLRVDGQEDRPCSLELLPAAGQEDWQVATSLAPRATDGNGFGHYRARDYDDLIDHPVEMGRFRRARFEAGGIPHEIVISGRHEADMERLCRDLKRICEQHIALFGELPDIERYVFLVMATGDGYGGLEHRASTSLLCSRDDLPRPGMQDIDEGYRRFLGLCSHEYFHTWNVKRIQPAVFQNCSLEQETHTRQLWAFEGITSYYDDLALLRSGLIDLDSYLELLGQTATRVWRGPGRFLQSVADSSFDAWTKFYKQDENAPNAIVSYYTKGALLALTLDMKLRRLSDDRCSLDDLMRRLWRDYGKPGRGLEEGEIEALANELARETSGRDLGDFFRRYLHGTEDLPLAEALAHVGIDFRLRPAEGAKDKGGTPPAKDDSPPAWLGAQLASDPAGVRLAQIRSGSPAMQAGLSAGDVIIAVDELKTDQARLETLLRHSPPGSVLRLHAFRRDELMRFEVTLGTAPEDTVFLQPLDACLAQRNRWLQG